MKHQFRDPFYAVEGKMQYLFDETGDRYLDLFAGIVTVSVGHCHPEVTKAVTDQAQLLQHTTPIYLTDQAPLFAKELAAKLPGDLKVAYFVNSGSEATDLALTLARLHTGNDSIVTLRNGYHGLSGVAIGALGHGTWRNQLPAIPGFHHALNPDPYRGPFGDDGARYALDVLDLIRAACPTGRVGGFIAETIQGVGGSVELAPGYLKDVYKYVRAHGGVTIADEVQSGFGRTGTHYWGFERQGVVPDIVTMAKGIGNGLPLAAVVTTPEIAKSLDRATHFNTFGGNPISCAAGRAVLRVVDENNFQDRCKSLGERFTKGLVELQAKHDIIGDVRGPGLMLGVELVTDRDAKTPATKETYEIMNRLREQYKILIGKGGYFGNVFRIKPPMCISDDDVDYFVEAFDDCLTKL